MIVPVRISKRRFGPVFTRDVVLLLCQLPPELRVGRHRGRPDRMHFLILLTHFPFRMGLAPENRADGHADGGDERGEKSQPGSARGWMMDPGHCEKKLQRFIRKRLPASRG